MKKTVTTYACDGCGKASKTSRELRPFNLLHRGRGRARWDYSDNADLCDECEGRLIAAAEPILGSSVLELRRPAESEKPKPKVKRGAVT